MNIYFRVRVNTKQGETVYITGSSPLIGKYDPENAFRMEDMGKNPAGETLWEAHLQFDSLKERVLFYKYFVKNTEGIITYEFGGGRRIALNSSTARIESIDHWQEYTEEAPFLTDPFAHVFYGAKCSPYTQTHNENNELIIRAVVPNVPADCRIVLCGEGQKLGNWKPEAGVKMARLKGLKWIASFDTGGCAGQTWKYRLAMVNSKTGTSVFETLHNNKDRKLVIPQTGRNETIIVEHSQVKFPPVYKKFAGCTAPVFSLRSNTGCGCGELMDLKLLADWAEKTGIKTIGILPVNDTATTLTGKDSSPYKCITSLGINPLYMTLSTLGELSNTQKAKDAQREIKSLNRRATVDYEDLYFFKNNYLKDLFLQKGKADTAHPDFYKFINQHKDWLYGYALFCSLRDFHKTTDFSKWGDFKVYSEDLCVAFGDKVLSKTFACAHSVLGKMNWEQVQQIHTRAQFYIWLQFNLFRQLDNVIRYAHSKGIAIKGELQMNIVPGSVDCWKFPQLFKQETDSCGNISFQKTEEGYAVFNWKAMEEDKFMWWKKRMRVMSCYVDIFSFSDAGCFTESERPIYEKMVPQLLAATNLMAWGNGWEKLRILPGFCAQDGQKAPYLSTITSSAATTNTLRIWLGQKLKSLSYTSEDKKQTYYDATAEECCMQMKETLCQDSMFAMVPIQDWMSLSPKLRSRFPYSERICNTQDGSLVWKYRMHINLESLLQADSLNKLISELISSSNR